VRYDQAVKRRITRTDLPHFLLLLHLSVELVHHTRLYSVLETDFESASSAFPLPRLETSAILQIVMKPEPQSAVDRYLNFQS
jgi:hypothetical protein